jgi:ABC-2 type transport system permease protein
MSWQAIARKDFRDARRSYWLWGLSALFILLVAGTALVLSLVSSGEVTSSRVLSILKQVVSWTVPLIAIVMSYGAVIGERETGSLRLLLAPPHSRRDVVVGKFVGRAAAVVGPVLAGFVIPAFVFAVLIEFEPAKYFGFAALSALLAVLFVAIAVGVSAAVSSRRIALVVLLSLYLVFVAVWGSVRFWLTLRLQAGYPDNLQWIPIEPPTLLDALQVLNPSGAMNVLFNNYLNGSLFSSTAPSGSTLPFVATPEPDPQFHLIAVLMVAAWIVVSVAVGAARFETADL